MNLAQRDIWLFNSGLLGGNSLSAWQVTPYRSVSVRLGPLVMQVSVIMRRRVGALGPVVPAQPQEVLYTKANQVVS